ncbi:MAG: DUF4185 domain-containing protein [Candidatus Omnitrophica bacterium]|nr:DUF4185 domain-containing protein [Candidatus Omnitrophota bacterium]
MSKRGQTKLLGNPRPDLEQLFRQGQKGYSGADGCLSFPLSKGRDLWMFGDTIVGGRNHPEPLVMPRNSVGVLHSDRKGSREFSFHWKEKKGVPYDFFDPPKSGQWLWPGTGCLSEDKIFFFLRRMRTDMGGQSEAFHFAYAGPWVIRVENPKDNPDDWIQTPLEVELPRSVMWGSASFADPDGYVYLWGGASGRRGAGIVVARTPAEQLHRGRADRWEFFHRKGEEVVWSRETSRLATIIPETPSEISLSYLKKRKLYLIVYGNWKKNLVGLRVAKNLMGPWSPYLQVYSPPEPTWCDQYFCYASKGHTELDPTETELIITYMCNSHDIWRLTEDDRVYYPRFISVPLDEVEKVLTDI